MKKNLNGDDIEKIEYNKDFLKKKHERDYDESLTVPCDKKLILK